MLRRSPRPVLSCCLAFAACAAPGPVPPSLSQLLADGRQQHPARLWLDGNRISAAAVDLGPGALPAAVRTSVEAVAPQGEVTFQGREWGPRGTGFRIEKQYRIDGVTHTRSALVADDGTILERAHSVPIAQAPQDVLATAMHIGPQVEDVQIVSGSEHEEAWRCTVTDRLGHQYLVTIDLDGRLMHAMRRLIARVDV